jgi:DNA-binding response OmpR family regulator
MKTILIIDDEKVIRDHLAAFFRDIKWNVFKAPGGEAALKILERENWLCDCIILDKKMPEMDGLSFLKIKREKEPKDRSIPVIVLSAYVSDEADKLSFIELGTTQVFQKPEDTELLAAVVKAITSPMSSDKREAEIKHAISAHEIDEKVKHHEDLIGAYYKEKISEQRFVFHKTQEPLFVVARRWNSWYPSFFDVPGGSYAMVFPVCKETKRNRIAVIDPGFRFLKILSNLGLSIQDIETCIITHNHPDHIGGVFEYIACRRQADKPVSFHCNPSTQRMLSNLAQANIITSTLPDDNKEEIVIQYKDRCDKFRALGVRAFATDHREVGWDSDSRGIILTCHSGEKDKEKDSLSRTIILGDSAFDETNSDMDFPTILAGDENTKIVVVHIGSAQIKKRAGGHLYLMGLGRLVQQIAAKLEKYCRNKRNKLIILVSEWGLEHANADQMKEICPDVTGFDEASSIVSTVEFLRNNISELGYDRLTILPADIGLIIGMISGLVYIETPEGVINKVPADKVNFTSSNDGIIYSL